MRAVSDSTKYDNSPLQVVWRVSPVRCTANFTTIDYNRHNGKIYFGVQTHFEGEGTRELTESERARRGRCGWKYRIGNGAVIDPGQQGAGSVRTEAMAPGSYTITLSAGTCATPIYVEARSDSALPSNSSSIQLSSEFEAFCQLFPSTRLPGS